MTREEFAARYRLLEPLTTSGVRSHHAQDVTTGHVVMVHLLGDGGERGPGLALLAELERLAPADRAVLRSVLDVAGEPVVVTELLTPFTTFDGWLRDHATTRPAAPAASPPAAAPAAPSGEFTRVFGRAAPPAAAPPAAAATPPAAAASPVARPAAPPAAQPEPPAAAHPGDFTQLFGPGAAAPSGPPSGAPPASAAPSAPAPAPPSTPPSGNAGGRVIRKIVRRVAAPPSSPPSPPPSPPPASTPVPRADVANSAPTGPEPKWVVLKPGHRDELPGRRGEPEPGPLFRGDAPLFEPGAGEETLGDSAISPPPSRSVFDSSAVYEPPASEPPASEPPMSEPPATERPATERPAEPARREAEAPVAPAPGPTAPSPLLLALVLAGLVLLALLVVLVVALRHG